MNNPLQNIFTLLKDGKKGLVKSLAGEYDNVAIRNRMDNDITGNPVLMYSFTT
jgi:hypothetical protein